MFSMHSFNRRMLMQRNMAQPWIWMPPNSPDVLYAAVCLKGGGAYAGPADGLLPFAEELTHGASMMICDRAEALRVALKGSLDE